MLPLRIMIWSGLLNKSLETYRLGASKNTDDLTNINNEMDLNTYLIGPVHEFVF